MPEKSSFIHREISKEDALKQFYRPFLAGKANQALDIFERFVADCEMITTLGTSFQAGGKKLLITPKELQDNLDEFAELRQIAVEGRAFLDKLGYVSRRQNTPMVGVAPVGANVEVVPVEIQAPGQEPLQGVMLQPKK